MSLNFLQNSFSDNYNNLLKDDWSIIQDKVLSFSKKRPVTPLKPFSHPNLLIAHFDDIEKLHKVYLHDSALIEDSLLLLEESLALEQFLQGISKEFLLNFSELNIIAGLIESYMRFQKSKVELKTLPYSLAPEDTSKLSREFLKEFRLIVSPDGSVNYGRHPELKHLSIKLMQLEDRIRKIIGELSRSSKWESSLQFEGHDVINDCYVVALRADNYTNSFGRIRGRSETGKTLFIEPPEIRDLNNERQEILSEIDGIIFQLCHNFCHKLSPWSQTINSFYKNLTKLDQLWAQAIFSLQNGYSRPWFNNENALELRQFFHPLIENPIKNDIHIKSQKGLVISGPNTGGKTATLKSIALSSLLAQFGIFVPAKHANLPFFEGIYFLGNDGQNINQGLSSFSAEVQSYGELFHDLDKANLIVIDEIFNSTSSEEASALALGMIDQIAQSSRTLLFISTHHQFLKSQMHEQKDYISAHMEVDAQSLLPNFKLRTGIPGSSMALSTFQRLFSDKFLGEKVVRQAKNLLNSKMVFYEDLLQKVAAHEEQLNRKLQENVQLNKELKNQKQAALGNLRLQMEKLFKEKEKELNDLLDAAKEEADKLKESPKKSIREIEKIRGQMAHSREEELPVAPTENKVHAPAGNLEIGKHYFSTTLNCKVTLLEINSNKKQVKVSKGVMRTTLPLGDLKRAKQPKIQSTQSFHSEHDLKTNIDARGMRLDEFEAMTDRILYQISNNDIPFVTIIHGHGDGILKNHLRAVLKKKGHIFEWSRSIDDGTTTIKLR